jgi:hypothetical protein
MSNLAHWAADKILSRTMDWPQGSESGALWHRQHHAYGQVVQPLALPGALHAPLPCLRDRT